MLPKAKTKKYYIQVGFFVIRLLKMSEASIKTRKKQQQCLTLEKIA